MTISTVESVCRFSQEAAQAPDVALAEERADHDGGGSIRVVVDGHRAHDHIGFTSALGCQLAALRRFNIAPFFLIQAYD